MMIIERSERSPLQQIAKEKENLTITLYHGADTWHLDQVDRVTIGHSLPGAVAVHKILPTV